MDEKPMMLKPDNIFYQLYELLWYPNTKYNNKFSFKIPDTIFYKDNCPHNWIFTSKLGYIKRKHPDKLNSKEIIKKLLTNTKCEIIGVYWYVDTEKITLVPDEDLKENPLLFFLNSLGIEVNEKLGIERRQQIDKNKLKFNIVKRDKFMDFIENYNKRFGIFQLYIDSNNDPNLMFKIFWSEKKSITEMRIARQSFSIKNVHSYEKVVTYETDRFNILSKKIPSSVMRKRILECSNEIVKHLEALYTNIKIKSLILHFKENKNMDLYLTFSLGMILIQYQNKEKSIFITRGTVMQAELGDNFFINVAIQKYEKKYDLANDFECVNCNKMVPGSNSKEINFERLADYEKIRRVKEKTINICSIEREVIEKFLEKPNFNPILISHFNFENSKKNAIPEVKYPVNVSFKRPNKSNIPNAIRLLEPRLSESNFKRDKKEMIFKSFKTRVCETCYISINENKYMSIYEFQANILDEYIKQNTRTRFGKSFESPKAKQLTSNNLVKRINEKEIKPKLHSKSIDSFQLNQIELKKEDKFLVNYQSRITSASTNFLSKKGSEKTTNNSHRSDVKIKHSLLNNITKFIEKDDILELNYKYGIDLFKKQSQKSKSQVFHQIFENKNGF